MSQFEKSLKQITKRAGGMDECVNLLHECKNEKISMLKIYYYEYSRILGEFTEYFWDNNMEDIYYEKYYYSFSSPVYSMIPQDILEIYYNMCYKEIKKKLWRELEMHSVAVFLNTECKFIYDIALNVSEFL